MPALFQDRILSAIATLGLQASALLVRRASELAAAELALVHACAQGAIADELADPVQVRIWAGCIRDAQRCVAICKDDLKAVLPDSLPTSLDALWSSVASVGLSALKGGR